MADEGKKDVAPNTISEIKKQYKFVGPDGKEFDGEIPKHIGFPHSEEMAGGIIATKIDEKSEGDDGFGDIVIAHMFTHGYLCVIRATGKVKRYA